MPNLDKGAQSALQHRSPTLGTPAAAPHLVGQNAALIVEVDVEKRVTVLQGCDEGGGAEVSLE